ncbi:MAG: flagellar biosynthetic protein FliR [Planctomycetota bacterium]|nr:flagellar biosynthetic protein FliR [Planctomycetota bacterium]
MARSLRGAVAAGGGPPRGPRALRPGAGLARHRGAREDLPLPGPGRGVAAGARVLGGPRRDLGALALATAGRDGDRGGGGALIGFIALMPMFAMQTGGLIMAQQMGLGFARFYNPAVGDEADVLENMFFLLALVTFIGLGGIDWTVLAVLNSYHYVQVGALQLDASIPHLLSGLIMASIEVGMRVAAPLLALVFLETIAMGFIAKTVPQLNILSLGFPLRIMVGLGTIIAGVTVLGGVLVQYVDQVLVVMMDWYLHEGVADG